MEQIPLIATSKSVMNGPAGRSTGEGGGALGSGKPPWGGKGGPILSQDLNRHDGSWSRRHGRCRPASLHHFFDRVGAGPIGVAPPLSACLAPPDTAHCGVLGRSRAEHATLPASLHCLAWRRQTFTASGVS